MERRKFLKSLLSAGVMLSPISTFIENYSLSARDKAVVPDDIFNSEPYSIIVQNFSKGTISSVDVFGSCEYLNHPGFNSLGRLELSDVEIYSVTEGKRYVDILYNLLMSPTTFDKLVIERSESMALLEPFEIVTRDANGDQFIWPIKPFKYITPVDNGADSVLVEDAIRIDGFTKVVLHNLRPGERIALRFYASEKIKNNQLPDYLIGHRAKIIKGIME